MKIEKARNLRAFRLQPSIIDSNSFSVSFPLALGKRQIRVNTNKVKNRISRHELALKYQKMVNSSEVGSRAALARKLGVSRAYVTKVMRELK